MEQQVRDHATRLARVEQRVEDLALSVRTMAPLVAQHAELNAQVGHLTAEVHGCRDSVGDLTKQIRERELREADEREAREEREAADRRTRRNAYIAGAFAIFVQLLAILGGFVLMASQGSP